MSRQGSAYAQTVARKANESLRRRHHVGVGGRLYGVVHVSGSSVRLKDKSAWSCFNPVTYKRVLALIALVLAVCQAIPTARAAPDGALVLKPGRALGKVAPYATLEDVNALATMRRLRDPVHRMNQRFLYSQGVENDLGITRLAGAQLVAEKGLNVGFARGRYGSNLPAAATPDVNRQRNRAGLAGRILQRAVSATTSGVLTEYAMIKENMNLCRSASVFREDSISNKTLYGSTSSHSTIAFLIDGQDALDRGKMHAIHHDDMFSSNCPLAPRCGMANNYPAASDGLFRVAQNKRRRLHGLYQKSKAARLVVGISELAQTEANVDIDDGMILGMYVAVTDRQGRRQDEQKVRDTWQTIVDIAHGGQLVANKLGGINRLANVFAVDPVTHKMVKIVDLPHFLKLNGIITAARPAAGAVLSSIKAVPTVPTVRTGTHYVKEDRKVMRRWGFTGKQDRATVNRVYRGHASKYWLRVPANLARAHAMAKNHSLLPR